MSQIQYKYKKLILFHDLLNRTMETLSQKIQKWDIELYITQQLHSKDSPNHRTLLSSTLYYPYLKGLAAIIKFFYRGFSAS